MNFIYIYFKLILVGIKHTLTNPAEELNTGINPPYSN